MVGGDEAPAHDPGRKRRQPLIFPDRMRDVQVHEPGAAKDAHHAPDVARPPQLQPVDGNAHSGDPRRPGIEHGVRPANELEPVRRRELPHQVAGRSLEVELGATHLAGMGDEDDPATPIAPSPTLPRRLNGPHPQPPPEAEGDFPSIAEEGGERGFASGPPA